MRRGVPRRRAAGAALWWGLAAALLPPAAQAGRAQVGIGMATWATTDLDEASATARSWRDGLPLQVLSDAADPPDRDWARVSLQVDGVARSRSARAEAQAQARLRGSGQLFSGQGAVASDVDAGTLALQWRSDLAQDPAAPAAAPREGYARGYPYAELWESFELLYPIDRVAPVAVTLDLRLDGRLAGNAGRATERAGVEAYLSLGGVDTGENHFWLDPVWRSEGDVAGALLSFSGPLRSTGCSVARGVCSGFISVYAALDLRGRTPGDAADAWQTARAPLDAAFAAGLSLRVSDGVTLLRGDVSDVLPPVAWAQVASVPEPGPAALLAAGLAVLGLGRLRKAVRPGMRHRLRPTGQRRARAAGVAGAAALLAALWPATGRAQTWQLTADLLANAVQFSPGPGITDSHGSHLDLLNQPAAGQLQLASEQSRTPVGGLADARFKGRVGLLKAYAAASNPYCCDLAGHTVTIGYSNATVQARFYDTVAVQGAGLADGTPVRYQVAFDIDGSLSTPVFESGGFLSVDGLAEVRLRDLSSQQEVSLRWDASRDATGRHLLTLDTQVGHQLGLSGMLYAGAYVGSYARLGRSAQADFYQSAGYALRPSVAGLNTVGASGFDYLAPVPEPAAAALLLAGLAALGGRAVLRRCGPRAA